MKTYFQQIQWSILILVISLLIVSPMQAMAFEVQTHRAINEKNAAKGSSLHQYLINQLGLKDGVETEINKKWIIKYISDGGEYEDNPGRPSNHFHNPLTNLGLFGASARAWAISPVGVQGPESYSWNDTRSNYYLALTSKDKTSRENYFATTFRGIGQVMHLVQDMSIPAHTRNDPHPTYPLIGGGDLYELWAKGTIRDTTQVSLYPAGYFSSSGNSFLIPNLFDTDQYTGTNPGITTSSSNIGLAEYTNANFLSANTIFKNFTYPDWSNLEEYDELEAPGKTATYQRKTSEGMIIEHFVRGKVYYDALPQDKKNLGLMLDDKVHADYAQFLVPRAIGYSSQVLSYFFRGQLNVEMGEGSLKVKNASTEAMTGGKFELYYDNANGDRTLVTSAGISGLNPGGVQTIAFKPEENAESYMLVYQGQLGNESDAVIGKFIPVELTVITVGLRRWRDYYPYDAPGEFYFKKSVFVWNPARNSLTRAPVDYDDTDFQAWYKGKKQVDDQSSLFSSPRTLCGSNYLHPGTWPSGCPEIIPEMVDTAHNEDSMTKVGVWENGPPYMWQDLYLWVEDNGYDIKAVGGASVERYESIFYPVSAFYTVLLPGSPVSKVGFRTQEEFKKSGSITDISSNGNGSYYGGSGSYSSTSKDTFYGPLGEIGSFESYSSFAAVNYVIFGGSPPIGPADQDFWGSYTMEDYSIPSYQYGITKKWFSYFLGGVYTEKFIANACIVQFFGLKTHTAGEDSRVVTTQTLDDTRTIFVQAQALYALQGTTGYDWVAQGRNTALEVQIIAAINMAYSLNNIPANEIRGASIGIEIVK